MNQNFPDSTNAKEKNLLVHSSNIEQYKEDNKEEKKSLVDQFNDSPNSQLKSIDQKEEKVKNLAANAFSFWDERKKGSVKMRELVDNQCSKSVKSKRIYEMISSKLVNKFEIILNHSNLLVKYIK